MAEGSNNHYAPSRDLLPDLPVLETNPDVGSLVKGGILRNEAKSPVCSSSSKALTGLVPMRFLIYF